MEATQVLSVQNLRLPEKHVQVYAPGATVAPVTFGFRVPFVLVQVQGGGKFTAKQILQHMPASMVSARAFRV